LSLLLFGCSNLSKQATAQLMNKDGKSIGTVQITESNNEVEIKLQAQNLPPGPHAFHIHEVGTCTAPDFKSAGAHFNPTEKQHGHLNPKGNHLGDLQNVVVQEDGTVSTTRSIKNITLKTGESNSLFKPGGTAFVIHEKMDDEKTDPTGAAGARIACGEIKAQAK
jgi:Cu-Zn family superoxide dismutase